MDDLKRGRVSLNREGDSIIITVDKGHDIEWSVQVKNTASPEEIKHASDRLISEMTHNVPFDILMGCYRLIGSK